MLDLVVSQLTDLFRIGLIVGLYVTMRRTSGVTGRVLPLVLGVVFVAVMLPSVLRSQTVALGDAILAGLLSNAIILGGVVAAWAVVSALRPRR